MKTSLKITGLLLIGSSLLFAECTSEKKAMMIMNGVEQSIIDKLCTSPSETKTQAPVIEEKKKSERVIAPAPVKRKPAIKRSVNTNKKFSKPLRNVKDVSRSRLYISASIGSGTGTENISQTSYSQTYDSYYNSYSDSNYNYYDYTRDFDVKQVNIALGYVLQSNNRIQISSSTNTLEYENGYTVDLEGIDADFIWVFGQPSVSVGGINMYVSFGSGSHKYTANNISGNGISFNGGLGFIYTLNSSLEIDIGYNVKTFVWETFTDRYDAGDTVYIYEADITTRLSNLSASFRLKF